MSAIHLTCSHCGGHYLAGMVGKRAWPAHVCPDGTTGAPAVGFEHVRAIFAKKNLTSMHDQAKEQL